MRIRIIDAFTDRPFAGNPAGVCLVSDWPSASWMQQVAAELNLSETAFARPHEGADADWDLRWFTPVNEVDLCGHATLATAHALSRDGGPGTVRFSSRSGILITHSRADGTITLDFPVATLDRKSTRLNSSHLVISYAAFCLKKKTTLASAPPRPLATATSSAP